MNSTITIPARVVPLLRRGLLGELGRNAGLIDRATLEPHSDHSPDPIIGRLEALEAHWLLLNDIGWQEDPHQHDLHISHATHIWALSTALNARLRAERDHLQSNPPRRERRQARRNARRIERFLTASWLMFKTPPSVRLARWVRHHTPTVHLPLARIAPPLPFGRARRGEHRAPADIEQLKRRVLDLLIEEYDGQPCPTRQIARRLHATEATRQAIGELRQAGLIHTVGDHAHATLAARTYHHLHTT